MLLPTAAFKGNASADAETIRYAQSNRQVWLGSDLSLLLIQPIEEIYKRKFISREKICKISNKENYFLDCQNIGFLMRKVVSLLVGTSFLYPDD